MRGDERLMKGLFTNDNMAHLPLTISQSYSIIFIFYSTWLLLLLLLLFFSVPFMLQDVNV